MMTPIQLRNPNSLFLNDLWRVGPGPYADTRMVTLITPGVVSEVRIMTRTFLVLGETKQLQFTTLEVLSTCGSGGPHAHGA